MEKENNVRPDRHLNLGRLFLGLLIIVIGLAYLAQNSGLVSLNINIEWWRLWPIFIIFAGLSLLSTRGIISTIIGIAVTLVVLGLVIGSFFLNQSPVSKTNQNVNISRETGVSSADITLKTGAGKVTVAGGSKDLISGTIESSFLEYQTESSVADSVQKVAITGRGSGRIFGHQTNNVDLKLNEEMPVNMTIDAGAIDMNLDYSNVLLDTLDVNTGASTLNLTLGDKLDTSHVSVSAGASTVRITLPKTVGARIVVSSGLSSRNLSEFKKVSNNAYESNNYDSVNKKVDITLSLGASSLNVDWK